MIELILTFFSYAKLLLTVGLFTYIYKYFYESCSEKKIIKSKNEKPKKVIKTRISLSLIYLVLLTLFYVSLNWYVFFATLVTLLLLSIAMMHKFEPTMIDILKKYDSSPFVKKIWYIFSLIMNLIFKCFSPFHRIIDNKINKNKDMIKENFFGHFAKLNSDSTNSGILDIFNELSNFNISSTSSPQNDFNKLDVFLKKQKNVDLTLKSISENYNIQSPKSDYKDKDSELKSNNTKNEFNPATDVEEPLDTILLKQSINENNSNHNLDNKTDKNDITDFFNKMQIFKDKVKNTDIIINSNNQDVFYPNNDDSSSSDVSKDEESYIYKMD